MPRYEGVRGPLQGARYGAARILLGPRYPANVEQRFRMASKAARSKPNRELPSIKALLEDLTERVLSGELQTGPAAVANQLINTRLRAIEAERKIKETEELEARIEDLEAKLGQPRKGV
jgi:hypothetical protein